MSVITRGHITRGSARNSSQVAASDAAFVDQSDWSHRRSIVERILWGSTPEYCAECGDELRPGTAYRDAFQKTYCSVDHASRDRR